MTAEEAVIYLAGCAVNGLTPDRDTVESLQLPEVYQAARAHMLSACVAVALEAAGRADENSAQAIFTAVRRSAIYASAREAVTKRLEEAGIWYVPLKGILISADYPKPFMREMADHDYLYDASRAQDVKAIMEDLGFSAESVGITNHDVYVKPPFLCFEMHTALFGPWHRQSIFDYYKDVEARLLPGPGVSRHFSPEDLYIYLTAHEYKHFIGDGAGLRSLLDTCVFLKSHKDLDFDYIARETEKLGIADFERSSRELAQKVFRGTALLEREKKMLEFICGSGVFGTPTQHFEHIVGDYGSGLKGKLRYFSHRLILKRSSIREKYPFIYRHRVLYPFFCVYRIGDALIKKRKAVFAELRALCRIRDRKKEEWFSDGGNKA